MANEYKRKFKMANESSVLATGKASFSIPRIKKTTWKDFLQPVNTSNRDIQNLLCDIGKNCLDVNFMKNINVIQVFLVHNPELLSRYVKKRAEMKDAGRNSQTLTDQLGFLLTDYVNKNRIAKLGLHAKSDNYNKLGKGECGVYLNRFFDVEVNNARLADDAYMEIFVFKFFPGRCKSLNLGNIYKKTPNIEPTPNYDSHIASVSPLLGEGSFLQMAKSKIYLYEYTEECVPAKSPRHCLPFAVIRIKKLEPPKEPTRRINIPRDISSVPAPGGATVSLSSTDKSPSSVERSGFQSSKISSSSEVSKGKFPETTSEKCPSSSGTEHSRKKSSVTESPHSSAIVSSGATLCTASKTATASSRVTNVSETEITKHTQCTPPFDCKQKKNSEHNLNNTTNSDYKSQHLSMLGSAKQTDPRLHRHVNLNSESQKCKETVLGNISSLNLSHTDPKYFQSSNSNMAACDKVSELISHNSCFSFRPSCSHLRSALKNGEKKVKIKMSYSEYKKRKLQDQSTESNASTTNKNSISKEQTLDSKTDELITCQAVVSEQFHTKSAVLSDQKQESSLVTSENSENSDLTGETLHSTEDVQKVEDTSGFKGLLMDEKCLDVAEVFQAPGNPKEACLSQYDKVQELKLFAEDKQASNLTCVLHNSSQQNLPNKSESHINGTVSDSSVGVTESPVTEMKLLPKKIPQFAENVSGSPKESPDKTLSVSTLDLHSSVHASAESFVHIQSAARPGNPIVLKFKELCSETIARLGKNHMPSSKNRHGLLTPKVLSHGNLLPYKDKDTQNSEDVCKSSLTSIEHRQDQERKSLVFSPHQSPTTQETEKFEEKPLPKSISMRDLGIWCYFQALGDIRYQPSTVLVDYQQINSKKDCRLCKAALESVIPRTDMPKTISVITDESMTSDAVPYSNTATMDDVESDECSSSMETLSGGVQTLAGDYKIEYEIQTEESKVHISIQENPASFDNPSAGVSATAVQAEVTQSSQSVADLSRADACTNKYSSDVPHCLSHSESHPEIKTGNCCTDHKDDTESLVGGKSSAILMLSMNQEKLSCRELQETILTSCENISREGEVASDSLSSDELRAFLSVQESVQDKQLNFCGPTSTVNDEKVLKDKCSVQFSVDENERNIDINDDDTIREYLLEKTYMQNQKAGRKAMKGGSKTMDVKKLETTKKTTAGQKDTEKKDKKKIKHTTPKEVSADTENLQVMKILKAVEARKFNSESRGKLSNNPPGENTPQRFSLQTKMKANLKSNPPPSQNEKNQPYTKNILNVHPCTHEVHGVVGAISDSEEKKTGMLSQDGKEVAHSSPDTKLERDDKCEQNITEITGSRAPDALLKVENITLGVSSSDPANYELPSLTQLIDKHTSQQTSHYSSSSSSSAVTISSDDSLREKHVLLPESVLTQAGGCGPQNAGSFMQHIHDTPQIVENGQSRNGLSPSKGSTVAKSSDQVRFVSVLSKQKFLATSPDFGTVRQNKIIDKSSEASADIQEVEHVAHNKHDNRSFLVQEFLYKVHESKNKKAHFEDEFAAFQKEIHCLSAEKRQDSDSSQKEVHVLGSDKTQAQKNTSQLSNVNVSACAEVTTSSQLCNKASLNSDKEVLKKSDQSSDVKVSQNKPYISAKPLSNGESVNSQINDQNKPACSAKLKIKINLLMYDEKTSTRTTGMQHDVGGSLQPHTEDVDRTDQISAQRSDVMFPASSLLSPSAPTPVNNQTVSHTCAPPQAVWEAPHVVSTGLGIAQEVPQNITVHRNMNLEHSVSNLGYSSEIADQEVPPVFHSDYALEHYYTQDHVQQNHFIPRGAYMPKKPAAFVGQPLCNSHQSQFFHSPWVAVGSHWQTQPVSDFGDYDYRQFPQRDSIMISSNTAYSNYGGQSDNMNMMFCSNNTNNNNVYANSANVACIQNNYGTAYSNPSSSFWMSRGSAETSTISGLDFATSNSTNTSIPGLDTISQSQNDGEDIGNGHAESRASQERKESQETAVFDPRSILPEKQGSSHEEMYRSFLKSIRNSTAKEVERTDPKTIGIIRELYSDGDDDDDEMDISDDENRNRPLENSQSKENITGNINVSIGTDQAASLYQDANTIPSDESQDVAAHESHNSNMRNLLFIHLSNAIKKASRAPNIEKAKNKSLQILTLLRETLAKRESETSKHQIINSETNEQSETDRPNIGRLGRSVSSSSVHVKHNTSQNCANSTDKKGESVSSVEQCSQTRSAFEKLLKSNSLSDLVSSKKMDNVKTEACAKFSESKSAGPRSNTECSRLIIKEEKKNTPFISAYTDSALLDELTTLNKKSADSCSQFRNSGSPFTGDKFESCRKENKTHERSNNNIRPYDYIPEKSHKRRRISRHYRRKLSRSTSGSEAESPKRSPVVGRWLHRVKLRLSSLSAESRSPSPEDENLRHKCKQSCSSRRLVSPVENQQKVKLPEINKPGEDAYVSNASSETLNVISVSSTESVVKNSLTQSEQPGSTVVVSKKHSFHGKQPQEKSDKHTESSVAVNDKDDCMKTLTSSASSSSHLIFPDMQSLSTTSISVNSEGKVYLSDVPLDVLSYARAKILSEIDKLNGNTTDFHPKSQAETFTEKIRTTDKEEHAVNSLHQKKKISENEGLEDGELSSGSDKDNLKKRNYESTSSDKNIVFCESLKRECQSLEKGKLRKRRRQFRAGSDEIKGYKEQNSQIFNDSKNMIVGAKMDVGSENDFRQLGYCSFVSADVTCISSDSDIDSPLHCHRQRKEALYSKTKCDKLTRTSCTSRTLKRVRSEVYTNEKAVESPARTMAVERFSEAEKLTSNDISDKSKIFGTGCEVGQGAKIRVIIRDSYGRKPYLAKTDSMLQFLPAQNIEEVSEHGSATANMKYFMPKEKMTLEVFNNQASLLGKGYGGTKKETPARQIFVNKLEKNFLSKGGNCSDIPSSGTDISGTCMEKADREAIMLGKSGKISSKTSENNRSQNTHQSGKASVVSVPVVSSLVDSKDSQSPQVVKRSEHSHSEIGTKESTKQYSEAGEQSKKTVPYRKKNWPRESISSCSTGSKKRPTYSDRASPNTRSRRGRRSSSSSPKYRKRRRHSSSCSRKSLSSCSISSWSSSFSRHRRSPWRGRYHNQNRRSSSASTSGSPRYRWKRSRSISSDYRRRRRSPHSSYSPLRQRDNARKHERSCSSSRSYNSSPYESRRRYCSKSPNRFNRNNSPLYSYHRCSPKNSLGERDLPSKDNRTGQEQLSQAPDLDKSKNAVNILCGVEISAMDTTNCKNSQMVSENSKTSDATENSVEFSTVGSKPEDNLLVDGSKLTISEPKKSNTTSSSSDTAEAEDIRVENSSKMMCGDQQGAKKSKGSSKAVSRQWSAVLSHGEEKVEWPRESSYQNSETANDYRPVLNRHRVCHLVSSSTYHTDTCNVTVKDLIISQLGISYAHEIEHVLPYSLNTVLNSSQYSLQERNRKAFETILQCLKYMNILTTGIMKSTIEPVINSFGNPPHETHLEYYPDEQILLEVNVIKQCMSTLEIQQRQRAYQFSLSAPDQLSQLTLRKSILEAEVNAAKSQKRINPCSISTETIFRLEAELMMLTQRQSDLMRKCGSVKGRIASEADLAESVDFKPGTFSGEPLPPELTVPLYGFNFHVPMEDMLKGDALSVKDSMEFGIQAILELYKCVHHGRENFRVPEILLFEEEKYELYAKGDCFLVLSRPIPKKVFVRLLSLKHRIELLIQDKEKNSEEKYTGSLQLISERASLLKSHVGNVTRKRANKINAQYDLLQECRRYLRNVIGLEGLRRMPVFNTYLSALRWHYEMLDKEIRHPSIPEYNEYVE